MDVISVDAQMVRLEGSVDFASAEAVRRSVERAIERCDGRICLSLSGVDNGKSLIVGLMMAWLRHGHRRGCEVEFRDIPPRVQSLIEFCGLKGVLANGNHDRNSSGGAATVH